MKKLIVLLSAILTLNAHAGFGWFLLGAVATSGSGSKTVNYGNAQSSNIFITMTSNFHKCRGYKKEKNSKKKVALALNLVLKVEEFNDHTKCLSILYSSAEGNQVVYVEASFEEFTTLMQKINSHTNEKKK